MDHPSLMAPSRMADGRRGTRPSALAIALAAALAVGAVTAAPAQAADPVTINLVTVNDFHGRIERNGAAAGAAALATAVNQIRATNPNTVFAAAGDLIGASTFTSFIQQDVPTIEALNAAGLDVSAAGNHEFDQGWVDLRDRVQGLADWEYISSNVFLQGTDDLALTESWTTSFDGVSIGFVGAVTEDLPSLVSPAGIAELEVRDVVASVNAAADRLRDGDAANGEADIVVLLVHEGAATTAIDSAIDPASPFGQIVLGVDQDVDAIVSGHTHLAYNHVIDGRPVISSGQYGERYSNMTITYDPDTAALSMSNEIISTTVPPLADDPTVAAIVAAATAAAAVPGAVQVGTITADLNRAQQPGVDLEGNPVIVENRGGESTIGNFVADVQLWAVQQDGPADIAFMNPGGLRTNLVHAPDGVITYREAADVQPFANTLMTMTLTGAQVKAVLEQQWQPNPASSRPFLKLGVNKELFYTYDPTADVGQRITHVYLDGVEIDPAAEYRVVANSFLASGGDNFTVLAEGTNRADTGKIDLQSMVDWFAANVVATPDDVQRAVGVHLSAPDADGYDVGDALTIDLSSLDFSTNEIPAGSVEVSLGGIPLGTAAVDRTLLEKYDEIGRAQLVTTIPEGLYGPQELVVTVPSTGTTATVPVVLDRAESSISLRLTSPRPRACSTVIVRVSIDAPVPIAGTFEVFVDGRSIGVRDWTPNGAGEVKVKLPKRLGVGQHLLEVVYSGDGVVDPSSASTTFRLR